MQLHASLNRALKAVLHREGIIGLYKGVSAVALGAGYVVMTLKQSQSIELLHLQ